MRLPTDAEEATPEAPPSPPKALKRGRSIYIYVILSVVLPALFLSALVWFTEEMMMRSLAQRGAEGLLCQQIELIRAGVEAQGADAAFDPVIINKTLGSEADDAAAAKPGHGTVNVSAGVRDGISWAIRVGSRVHDIRGLVGPAVQARLDDPPAGALNGATFIDSVMIKGKGPSIACSQVYNPAGDRSAGDSGDNASAMSSRDVYVVAWSVAAFNQKRDAITKALMTAGLLRYVLLPVVVLLVLMVVAVQLAIFYPNLRRLDGDINAVLRGTADRLTGSYPREVYPITSRFNEVIEDNDAALSYIRSLVTKIAHDLNNKLQSLVLAIDAPDIDRTLVRRQIAGLKNQIDRYQQLAISSRTESHAKWRAERFDLVGFVEDTLWVQRIDLTNSRNTYRLRVNGEILPDNPEPGDAALRPIIEVSGHKGDLEIMLANLLSNASKYGEGVIEVGLREDGGNIVIDVDDNGPGIPEDDRKRVFEEGTMLNPDQELPGTGFGLDIVMMIANLSRGEVRAGESDLGGARFTLTLPILARD